MGASSSTPPPSSYSPPLSHPTPSPPIKTMIKVEIIDIDGRRAQKEIDLEWTFSQWAKYLFDEYTATEKNLELKFYNSTITYKDHKSEKLKNFGFSPRSLIYISHEQKGRPLIIIVLDLSTGDKKCIRASPYWTYKQLCEELERNGVYGIQTCENDVIALNVIIMFQFSKDKTLRELRIKDLDQLTIIKHHKGC